MLLFVVMYVARYCYSKLIFALPNVSACTRSNCYSDATARWHLSTYSVPMCRPDSISA